VKSCEFGRGGVQKSASSHETMSKAKSSEQHLDISHSSIFFNLNVGSSFKFFSNDTLLL
jgi:hypothetical protein